MKKSWFDKNTGYFLHYSKPGNAVAQRLESEGHPSIEDINAGDTRQKLDFETGRLVPDERYREWKDERTQAEQEARQAFQQLKAAVEDPTTDWSNANVVKAGFTRCVTMFAFIARKLNS